MPDESAILDSTRAEAERALRDVRRTYAGGVFMAVAGAALLRALGPRGDDLDRLPSFLQIGIPTAFSIVEALALLTYFTIGPRAAKAVAAQLRGPDGAGNPSPAVARISFLWAYVLTALGRMFVLLVAVMLAGLLFRTTGRPWALLNFAGTIVLVAIQLPTRARMERWTGRRVADCLGIAPMPDDLG